MKPLFLIVVALFTLAACQPDETVVPAQPEQLVGEWQLLEPSSGYLVTLRFTSDPRGACVVGYAGFQLSGKTSVNGYTTQACFSEGPSIDSGPLGSGGISGISSTKMAGTPEAMQFEQTYLGNLGNVKRYEFTSKNRLRLHYEGAQPGVLVYKKIN